MAVRAALCPDWTDGLSFRLLTPLFCFQLVASPSINPIALFSK